MDGTRHLLKLGTNQQPQFSRKDMDLLDRAASASCSADLIEMCEEWKETGHPDLLLATALLYDRILRSEENRTFLDRVIQGPSEVDLSQVLVGIVPGAFYLDHRDTGADGARIRSLLEGSGLRTALIPIHSFGRVRENARIIDEWVRAQTATKLALITLSKGSADCRMALQMSEGNGWGAVIAWVSLSGLPNGTPLIAWLRRQPLRMLGVRFLLWLRGQSFHAAGDLLHGDGDLSQEWPTLPSQLRLLHVIGFPLPDHLRHPWAHRAYRRLASLGPSDGGGFLLEDTARMPGTLCPLWGVDHYLDPSWDSGSFLQNLFLAALASPSQLALAVNHEGQP